MLCYHLVMFSWAKMRQVYYALGVITFFALIGLILYLIYRPVPNCFDNQKNQNELGVDCGGICTKACAEQIKPLKIYWARPLLVTRGWYDLVAQVENLNVDFGVRDVPYTFYLYDADNVLITKKTGTTFVNAGERFLIFNSRVETGEKEIKKAFLEFSPDLAWERAKSLSKDISLERKNYTNTPKPSLRLVAHNDGLQTIKDIQILTVLSDINSNAFAASATVIDKLEPSSQKDAYFTWPTPFVDDPVTVDSYWRINTFLDN